MNSLAQYSDMRLVRILQGLDKRVGSLTRALREMILAEMGRRVAAAYAAEQRRLRASLRAGPGLVAPDRTTRTFIDREWREVE